ncbi:AEC family transporter [Giesbergeria sinuosa]
MKRLNFPSDGFWYGAERLNYFILFPALLFSSLSTAPLNNPALPRLLVAIILVLSVLGLGLVVLRYVRKWPASHFGVLLQGVLRFNTYLGIAVIGSLYHREGLSMALLMIAILVPIVNFISVLAFSAGQHTSVRALLAPIAKNPLILSCLAGIFFNLSGAELQWGTDRFLTLLANTSLPLGLLSVGSALQLHHIRGQLTTLVLNSSARLLMAPLITFIVARLMQLPSIETTILVLFFALPTAPTAYVLSQQMGGNSDLMASIITFQTLFSALSLLLVLALVV